jgi:putative membrane protein insertion efficiency factor
MPAEPGLPQPERLSAAQRSALALLTLYKILLSPLFPGSCRFLPSCSEYAREAVTVHGTVKGVWLAARRLSRCHPLGSSGLDPVPGRSPRMSSTRMY